MTHFALQVGSGGATAFGIGFAILFIFIILVTFIRRYKRCPSDRILVVYGKVGSGNSAKCIHGGAAFVWPVIQDYEFLDLTPISIEVDLVNALSKQNIRVNVPSRFTIGISTEPGVMQNAAERLLGLGLQEVQDLAKEIIFGQLRLVVASMDIEEINSDRDKFLSNISQSVESELKKVGLKLINVNITDIVDESGYIEALGKEAAAHAINAARKSVAEKNRDGSIGEANAKQDERTQVAAANAKAVEGENLAQIDVANSDSLRPQREAEAERSAIASEKVQAAKALEESYAAEREAELARAERERSSQMADVVVPAEIDKITELVEKQADAIKNIKIDKVTVWDSGKTDSEGKNSTAGFISGLYKSVPPLQDMFNMAGMELPEYLKGKDPNASTPPSTDTPAEEEEE